MANGFAIRARSLALAGLLLRWCRLATRRSCSSAMTATPVSSSRLVAGAGASEGGCHRAATRRTSAVLGLSHELVILVAGPVFGYTAAAAPVSECSLQCLITRTRVW